MTKSLQSILREDVGRSLPSQEATAAAAAKLLPTPLDDIRGKSSGAASHLTAEQQVNKELEEEGNEVLKKLREEQREVIDSLDLKQ
jgi:N-acetyltransferase 10